MDIPRVVRVRQRLDKRAIEDPEARLATLLESGRSWGSLPQGTRVAIAVGSRGIDRIGLLAAALVRSAREAGLEPFIVPAMGSHGGATPAGQLSILASLGIDETSCGARLDASMAVRKVGATAGGVEVFTSAAALDADAIVVVNRVAPHTGFSGPVQSGLRKMMAVGLGKVEGALSLHARGFSAGHVISEMADVVLGCAPVAFGVALVEDAVGRLAEIEVVRAAEFAARERELLELAGSLKASIPLSHAHVLVVHTIGKDISGIGMDPHVTGRGKDFAKGEEPSFHADRVVALRLSEGSLGNATGIGHADHTTERLLKEMDREVTERNVRTSGALHRAVPPPAAPSERQAVEAALEAAGSPSAIEARLVVIRSTADREAVLVTPALARELEGLDGVELSEEEELDFDDRGDLDW